MTYRADDVGLGLRIEQLEKDLAQLEGKRIGLEIGIAEAVDRMREAKARWKKIVQATRRTVIAGAGLVAGILGGTVVSGSIFMLLPFLIGSSVGNEFDAIATDGTRCEAVVDGWAGDPAVDPDDGGCTAVVICGGRKIYDGRGGCSNYFDDNQLEYWDHSTNAEDGTPALVIAETRNRLVMRDDVGGDLTMTLTESD